MPAVRKLKVTNVVEEVPVQNTDILVEQLLETTTAPIQNFTLSEVDVEPVVDAPAPVKRSRAKATDNVEEDAVKRRSKKSESVSESVPEAEEDVVKRRVKKVSPDTDAVEAEEDAVKSKRKPRAKKASDPVSEESVKSNRKTRSKKSEQLTLVMPEIDPFTPSASEVPATHEDVEVEEVNIDGTLYYKDSKGQLYDHTTFAPISK